MENTEILPGFQVTKESLVNKIDFFLTQST